MDVRPFRLEVEQRVLDDLRSRLARTRWATLATKTGWDGGTDHAWLRQLVEHWLHEYDWRAHEAEINALPQFEATVNAAAIHFVHARTHVADALPVLLLHGWPDSFYRFHKLLPSLAAFDVVVPSLPGYPLTGRVHDMPRQEPLRWCADLLWRLMTESLGYTRFAIAAGDGASALAEILAIDHPESIVALHLTEVGAHALDVDVTKLSRAEAKYVARAKKQAMYEGAQALVHATRPWSVAVALEDSPVGLASWLCDRFHAWCESDRDLEQTFGKDELLTQIMLYWVTRTIGTSIFGAHAEARSPSLGPYVRVEAPVAMALFPKSVGGIPPRTFAERTLNVQRWTELPRGSHLAPTEAPDPYARDIVEFFTEVGVER